MLQSFCSVCFERARTAILLDPNGRMLSGPICKSCWTTKYVSAWYDNCRHKCFVPFSSHKAIESLAGELARLGKVWILEILTLQFINNHALVNTKFKNVLLRNSNGDANDNGGNLRTLLLVVHYIVLGQPLAKITGIPEENKHSLMR